MYSSRPYYPQNSPTPHRPHQSSQNPHSNDFYSDTGSEIYIDQTYHDRNHPSQPPPPPPPRISRSLHQTPMSVSTTPRAITPIGVRPHTTTPSEYSSVSKTKKKRKGGVVIETMSAPNPCCPDSKGVCCILLLVNLGLLLVTLGFSVVLQIFEPPFVWYCGILFIIVGAIALIVSLLFCMRICTFSRWSNSNSSSSLHGGNNREPSELYWTHHWQKRINLPGTTSRSSNTHHDSDVVYHTNHHGSRGVTPSS